MILSTSQRVAGRREVALRCSNWNPFENSAKRQNAANLCVFSHLQQASQASDSGSIPIRRLQQISTGAANVSRRPNGAVGEWNDAIAD